MSLHAFRLRRAAGASVGLPGGLIFIFAAVTSGMAGGFVFAHLHAFFVRLYALSVCGVVVTASLASLAGRRPVAKQRRSHAQPSNHDNDSGDGGNQMPHTVHG